MHPANQPPFSLSVPARIQFSTDDISIPTSHRLLNEPSPPISLRHRAKESQIQLQKKKKNKQSVLKAPSNVPAPAGILVRFEEDCILPKRGEKKKKKKKKKGRTHKIKRAALRLLSDIRAYLDEIRDVGRQGGR